MAAVERPLEPTDEALLERARGGDRAAFAHLVIRYQEKFYRLASSLVPNPSDAEEVLQDSFLQAYRSLEYFRGDAKVSTWLYRIVTNTALMKRRAMRRHPAESLESYQPQFREDGRLERLDLDYGRAARVEDILEKEELAAKAREAIEILPETSREAFVLHDLEGLSTEATSEVLGIEPGAVRTRLHRARLALRGYLARLVGGA